MMLNLNESEDIILFIEEHGKMLKELKIPIKNYTFFIKMLFESIISIRCVNSNHIDKIISKYTNIEVIRRCSLCNREISIGDYIKTNYIKSNCSTTLLQRLIKIWDSKIVHIPCCFCFSILKLIEKGHIKKLGDLDVLHIIDCRLDSYAINNTNLIFTNLKKYKLIKDN